MNTYSADCTAIANEIGITEANLPLRNEFCQSRLLLQPVRPKRVCLLFHGFTSAPFQFMPMGMNFFKAGYNVLIPRLPGHGQAGDWDRKMPPPMPADPQVYQQFALDWLEKAQALGDQVIVGGLSGGGALAGWLGVERPLDISRVMMFAAYLSSSSRLVDLFVKKSDGYYQWVLRDPTISSRGYLGFALSSLRAFLSIGNSVLRKARSLPKPPPFFVLSSENDITVGNFDHRDLCQSLRSRQPMTWYYNFPHALEVPHTMLTQAEGNQWESVLNVMAKAFVESQLNWSEIEAMALRMTAGRTFNQSIADLQLQGKASPDMPAMMTMVDKRAIVLANNPGWNPQVS